MPTLRAASPCRPAWCTAGAADMICRPASSTCRHFFPTTMRKLSYPSERRLLIAGVHESVVGTNRTNGDDVPKQIMQILISGALLCPALCVILASKCGPKDKHLAYGIIG